MNLFSKKPKVDHQAIKSRVSFVLESLVDHYRDMCPGDFEELSLTFNYGGRHWEVTVRPMREGK